MFDHLEIAVSDLGGSRRFYRLALGDPTYDEADDLVEWGDFGITPASADHPRTRRLHLGFGVEDRRAVDDWWRRMTEAGYPSDGEPGPRPEYTETYYGGFVLDPDGNSIEAVHHYRSRTGEIDHVWLRTTDIGAVKQFYGTIAGPVGIELVREQPELVRYSDGAGSFTFVVGDEPTEHVHLAFGVNDREAVAAFHRPATEAGYLDNGLPGERPHYHPGYYAAFVIDPHGNNVEAVFHDRSS